MATSVEQFKKISDKLALITNLSYRPMMREYVVYYNGKVIGGIYDNELLVKPVEGLESLLPDAELQLPYEGAKPQVCIEKSCFDNLDLMKQVFETVYNGLPDKKKKR